MKKLVNKIRLSGKKSVLVIGDVMLDEYIFGDVGKISPEAPVPIVEEQKREWSLGGAANVALNCKHIGCHVDLIGVINSEDRVGQKLLDMLQENGIPLNGIVRSDQRVTTCKKRVMSNNQQLLRIDSEDSKKLSEDEFNQTVKKIEELITSETVVLVSDYNKGVITSQVLAQIISLAQKRQSLLLLDPKGPDFNKYKNVNYLKPNYKEYCQMLDFYGLSQEKSIVENGKKLCEILLLDGLVVTLGEKGIHFVSPTEDIFSPACKREVYDLTGAGDTVLAFLALGLAVNLPMRQCLKFVNHAAAVAVSHLKTYAVSLDELIDKNVDIAEKVFFEWALLKIELDWIRLERKRVVFTNGCFDLLHSGHIKILNEAKKLGDILVVAVNTDDSVKRFKGSSRPIKTLSERVEILSAIGVVDFVAIFDQDTPKELIEYLRPDVLVKGGDYQKEKVAGYDFMINSGGSVEIIDLKKGKSTTNLVMAVKNQEKMLTN